MFFNDLPYADKLRAIRPLLVFFSILVADPNYLHFRNKSYPSDCGCKKFEIEKEDSLWREIHLVLADHVPLWKCDKCGFVTMQGRKAHHEASNCSFYAEAIDVLKHYQNFAEVEIMIQKGALNETM